MKPIGLSNLFNALSQLDSLHAGENLTPEAPPWLSAEEINIMIVEDNPVNMMLARTIVKGSTTSQTFEAENGKVAVDLFKLNWVDVILMDVQMPIMSGYEATRLIREHENGKMKTPIIALTAGTVKGERDKCLEAGMNDYITKPIVKGALEKALQEWLNLEPNLEPIAVKGESASSNEKIHFNKLDLSHRLGNDTVFMSQLLEIADRQLQEFLVELHELFAQQNLNGIKSLAHKLKGTALSSGFDELANLAEKLEKREEFDHDYFEQVIKELEQEILITRGLLRKRCKVLVYP
jgi:CheY-like chemotaxis protein/HPt (histidine-containing phosphotransfer) domain-containing protein